MIIATLRVKVPADQRKIFLDSARSVTGRTSVQPGCISCKFYQDIDDPDSMLFVEEWSSCVEYEHHIKSVVQPSLEFGDNSILRPRKFRGNSLGIARTN